jgi:hypothetical protein
MVLPVRPIAAVMLVFLFFACKIPVLEYEMVYVPKVRAALKSSGNGSIKVTVYVEGPDGNALSGSVVTIRDEENFILPLSYVSANCSYNGVMEDRGGYTPYVVEVEGVLFSTPFELTVPYTAFSRKPNVTVFQDAEGNSVLGGQSIVSNRPVQIGWSLCGDGVVYQISFKTSLTTIFSASTGAGAVTIPANILTPGYYVLEITAQKIHGDLYFKSAPYCAVSVANASMVSCNVK